MASHYGWKVGDPPPQIGEHSVAKHNIFSEYLGIYIDRLTRTPSQTKLNLTIVDGFCGGGLYSLRGREVEGSPMRLLQAVETAERKLNEARSKGFSVRADFFFVDHNPEHITFLRHLLTQRGYGSRIGEDIFIECMVFEDSCSKILTHIQRKGRAHRSLFFLDQYGWSDVRFATIRNILNSLNNPEILLTFSVDSLINFLSEKTPETQALMNIELAREDVRELMAMRNSDGWRYLIQNGLYHHVQSRTGARFYTPFFVHSVESNRSYWLLHLSNHRQARDEMGKLHWRVQNHFQHHGGAGFHALGFDPSQDLRQGHLKFMFDDDALKRSEYAVLQQLPELIHGANSEGGSGLRVETLFTEHCNDTPVTSDILSSQIRNLRDEGELYIVAEDGQKKVRSKTVSWTDRLVLPTQKFLFSRLNRKL